MKESSAALNIPDFSCPESEQYLVDLTIDNSCQGEIHALPFNYSEASDEALVCLYTTNKDERAFNEIVSRYNDILIGFAMKFCKNPYDAEDIKQEVLLILATKLHTFKGNSKFSTWLYRVTLNTCYKQINDTNKKNKREIYLDDSFINQTESQSRWARSADEMIQSKEQMKIINIAVNELSDSNKKIFNLKDINGYSNAQIGECMGLSISAVKSRVLRTRLTIKEKITHYF
ncbi:MAG: sigma-70 family RNA polymerase sigma factor [Thermodesulfobacteriota bacterium]